MALTDAALRQTKAGDKPYKLADEKGLYILVNKVGMYWRVKYRFGGKEKVLALGVYPEVSLRQARAHRDKARELLADGIDPSTARKKDKAMAKLASANSFKAVAVEWMARQTDKTQDVQYRNRYLLQFAIDAFGSLPITEVDGPMVLAVCRPYESVGKLETAKRILTKCRQVFHYAGATGRLKYDPTAMLRGALKTPKAQNHAALTNPKDVAGLLRAIDAYHGTPAVTAALKLSPLLFCRPGELRQMEWTEINWNDSRWEIPAEKMKMRMPHIVPLSTQALAILRNIHPITGRSRYVFPSARGSSRPLSGPGVRLALQTMGYASNQMTPHGFRAMARTILDEVLRVDTKYIEHQLAHAVKDANGTAYNRTAFIDERRQMMQQWADYLDSLKAGGNVVVVNFRG